MLGFVLPLLLTVHFQVASLASASYENDINLDLKSHFQMKEWLPILALRKRLKRNL